MDNNPKPYQFDWDGSCAPDHSGHVQSTKFSVGVFQWIPKKGGGLKRSRAIKRIRGYSSDPQKVYDQADEMCREFQKAFGYKLHPMF